MHGEELHQRPGAKINAENAVRMQQQLLRRRVYTKHFGLQCALYSAVRSVHSVVFEMCKVCSVQQQRQSRGGDGTLGGDNEEAGFNIIQPTHQHQPANSQRPNLFQHLKAQPVSLFLKIQNQTKVLDYSLGRFFTASLIRQ